MGQHEANQRLGDRYELAFADVRTVVSGLDPMGLLASGAPDDEYDPQVTDLVRLVLRPDPFGEAQVDEVWRRWFGDDYSAIGTSELAAQVNELGRLQRRYAPS